MIKAEIIEKHGNMRIEISQSDAVYHFELSNDDANKLCDSAVRRRTRIQVRAVIDELVFSGVFNEDEEFVLNEEVDSIVEEVTDYLLSDEYAEIVKKSMCEKISELVGEKVQEKLYAE